MDFSRKPALVEDLESRTLLAFAGYAKLVSEDGAAANFPKITGKGVTVAVIDTGIDYTQKVLGGGFGPNFKVIAGHDFYDDDDDPMDESGHGTSVAGVIAARPYKVSVGTATISPARMSAAASSNAIVSGWRASMASRRIDQSTRKYTLTSFLLLM